VSPTIFFDASATDSHTIGFTISEDLSNLNQAILSAEIGNAACDDAGLPHNACTVAFAAGSVQVTLTIYAVGGVALSSIQAVADANFGNATAMQTFLQAATGSVFTVSGYTAVSTSVGASDAGGGSSSADGLHTTIIAVIAVGAFMGLVLVCALVYIVQKRASPKVAPWPGKDGKVTPTSSTKQGKRRGKTTRTAPSAGPDASPPPSPTDLDRIEG